LSIWAFLNLFSSYDLEYSQKKNLDSKLEEGVVFIGGAIGVVTLAIVITYLAASRPYFTEIS